MQPTGNFFKIVTICFALLFFGCGSSSDSSSNNDQAMNSEAGYYDIPSINYNFRIPNGTTLNKKSSEARIFYSYLPGDEIKAKGKTTQPLFVFLNGGPGCATTLNLFSMNTAPYTLDQERTNGKMFAPNPYTWSTMGNLLYIDAPNTGFSYNMIETPENSIFRLYEFMPANYNPLLDAAQVVRVILKFLDGHSGIAANDIIIVGESYGGTRVSAMLNMLLFYEKYSSSGTGIYEDNELIQTIKDHFEKYFPGRTIDSKLVASQFGRQILIQPQLTGPYQDEITEQEFFKENSIIDKLAAEEGKVWDHQCNAYNFFPKNFCLTMNYLPKELNRDPYLYTRNATWTNDMEAFSTQSLLDVDVLSTVIGQDVREISKIKPINRAHACRYSPLFPKESGADGYLGMNQEAATILGLPEEAVQAFNTMLDRGNYIASKVDWDKENSLENVLGRLDHWDDYLIGTNMAVYVAYFMTSQMDDLRIINADISPIYGEMFLNNLSLVKTFLTDSELDLIIYSPALTESLKKYTEIVDSIDVVRGKDYEAERSPGYVTIYYKPGSLKDPESTPVFTTVYYPYYAKSGHSVSSAQPGEFRQDVINWLKEN